MKRTDEIIAETFPDRGERPSDKVIIDENAEPAPNVAHEPEEPDNE